MKTWLKYTETGVRLILHVQPGAKKTEICGEHGEALKIRLAAPPVDGKANAALIAWFADCFELPRRSVQLMSGEKNRHKVIELAAQPDEGELLHRLGL